LGDPVISTDSFGGVWVAAFNNTLALRCCVGDRTGAKQPAQPWYRQAKQNQARREDYLIDLIETDDDSLDANGSDVTWLVQDLADSDDDAAGISPNARALPERFGYDAYGTVDGSQVGDDVATDGYSLKIGFQDGLMDSLTGLVHFGARDFDPTIGRWMEQESTAGYVEGTNVYQAELGDPIENLNPLGD